MARKNVERTVLLGAALAAWAGTAALAHEWCIPDTLNTYAASSPVITNVAFAEIDRTTDPSDKELYVHTLESTDVLYGETYPLSVTYTLDLAFCPTYAVRVWIDWGQDESFDDPGDLVVSADDDADGIVTGDVTVPMTAAPGLTRMRVALKMMPICGHTPIEACPEPEEFGWHGEIEDYNVVVTALSEIDCTNGLDEDFDGDVDCADADCAGDPACAMETDCADGLDDDDDGLVDCADPDCVADPAGDCDGDGESNATDCAPADGGAFALPEEVAMLRVDAVPSMPGSAQITWTSVGGASGLDTVHDVVSGRLADLHSASRWTDVQCLVPGGEPGTMAFDDRRTFDGSGAWWFLVRGANACGLGPAGVGSAGEGRELPDGTCR